MIMYDTKAIVNKILSKKKINEDKISLNKKNKCKKNPEEYTANEVLKSIGESEYDLSQGC